MRIAKLPKSFIQVIALCTWMQGTTYAVCPPGGGSAIVASEGKNSVRASNDVYAGLPFSEGEELEFRVSYFNLDAGQLFFRVWEPKLFDQQWHMSLESAAITSEWYGKIFKAQDEGIAYIIPGNYRAHQFKLTQDHKPLFGRHYTEDKLLTFDYSKCSVTEEFRDETGKVKKTKQADLDPDATDILGALYKLRTVDFEKVKEERIKVYTSEKNWWLHS